MNTLIVDVDGVLLDWRDTFVDWMIEQKFIDESKLDLDAYDFDAAMTIDPLMAKPLMALFNETYRVGMLPPVAGAVSAIQQFHRAGYQIKAVTAFSDNFYAKKIREQNLINVFGHVFQDIHALPLRSPKLDFLSKQQKDSLYVEDLPKHLHEGLAAGFKPWNCFMIPQVWNAKDREPMRTQHRIQTWTWSQIVNNRL